MVVSQTIAVSKIEENPWNPNKMPAEAYGALLKDMKKGGPSAIDPILITIVDEHTIVVDGNHRLRAARELGWSKIPVIVDPTISTEEKARMVGFSKNYERGTMDPYKQAEYFKWFVDRGWTHEKIAKEHRIDRTTVTKVLSLIKIEPEVREKLADVPRVTISHLEPIATLKPKQQHKFAKELSREYKRESPPVRTIEHRVEQIKREEREAEELRKAVEKAKFPKCPTCGKPARKDSWRKLPWVRCENYHEWSLETGPIPREPAVKREKKPGKPPLPKYIRSTYPIDDFRKAFGEYARGLIPKIEEISDLSCWGNKGRRAVHVHADLRGTIVSLSVDIDGTDYSLHVEPKTYASEKLKQFKTSVTMWPEPKNKKDLAKLEQLVSEIFEKVGGK